MRLILLGLVAYFCALDAFAVVRVSVTVAPIQFLVDRVGGACVVSNNLLENGLNPATYELTGKQLARLHEADLLLTIGVPYESNWLPAFISGKHQTRVVDITTGVQWRYFSDNETHDHDHDHEEEHEPDKALRDPHLWLSTQALEVMASNVSRTLVELNPICRADIEQNTMMLMSDIADLRRNLQQIMKPIRGQAFLTFHPAWGYFSDEFGLQQIAVEHEGKAPLAKRLVGIMRQYDALKIMVFQQQFSRTTSLRLAESLKLRPVMLDPLEYDVLANLRRIASALRQVVDAQ